MAFALTPRFLRRGLELFALISLAGVAGLLVYYYARYGDRFDTFIDLTTVNEMVPYANILLEQVNAYNLEAVHHRFPIGDFGLPTPETMNDILNRIEESLQAGRKIYLHCWGGIGRTGTTVGCYLVRQGNTAEQALDQLAAWWRGVPKSQYHPHSPETGEQVNFIRTWAAQDAKLRNYHK